MERRNTIQKELVLNAVLKMHGHVTAENVYEHIQREHPAIGKGTVYRNLNILAEEGKIRKIEIPDGPDRFDFMTKKHYHIQCVGCGSLFDVDMDVIPALDSYVHDSHGMIFLDHEILFKGICPECQKKEER